MDFNCKQNEPLAKHCYMRVGGNAGFLAMPESKDELAAAVRYFAGKGKRYIVVGNCSNLIFPDEGFDGAVIVTCGVRGIECAGVTLTTYCGETLSALARAACNNSVSGFEFCYGIPGTVGGGVYMNAGAYGGEISDVFTECRVLDKNLDEITLYKDDMDFGYRKSVLQTEGYILLSASFVSQHGDSAAINAKMEELMAKRKASQPLEYPSCGSTFKRPVGHYAGTLIEQCGLKGASVGGAEVSQKHAGFIINKNNATSSDIVALMRQVIKTVYEKTGVVLEPEVKLIDIEL